MSLFFAGLFLSVVPFAGASLTENVRAAVAGVVAVAGLALLAAVSRVLMYGSVDLLAVRHERSVACRQSPSGRKTSRSGGSTYLSPKTYIN